MSFPSLVGVWVYRELTSLDYEDKGSWPGRAEQYDRRRLGTVKSTLECLHLDGGGGCVCVGGT